MNQDAFPFFDWVHNALFFIFQLLVDAFNVLFLFLARICELLVASIAGAGDRAFGFLQGAVIWLRAVIHGAIARHIDWLRELIEWAWSLLADVLGVALLWLEAQLPSALTFNLAGIITIVSYLKSVTYLIDVPFIVAVVTAGLVMAWSIQIIKIVVRLCPFIG